MDTHASPDGPHAVVEAVIEAVIAGRYDAAARLFTTEAAVTPDQLATLDLSFLRSERWGYLPQSDPIDPSHEAVYWIRSDPGAVAGPDGLVPLPTRATAPQVHFLMQLTPDGWRVASLRDRTCAIVKRCPLARGAKLRGECAACGRGSPAIGGKLRLAAVRSN